MNVPELTRYVGPGAVTVSPAARASVASVSDTFPVSLIGVTVPFQSVTLVFTTVPVVTLIVPSAGSFMP